MREKATGDLRKLYTEKLHDLYSSPDMIRVIKSKTVIWAGHVECMGVKRNEGPWQKTCRLEDLSVDKKIILI